MKYVDYKATIWGRLTFSDDADMNKVIEKLNDGFLPAEIACEEELKFRTFHFLDDTEEHMTPEENNGCHTIEVYDDDNKMIWTNVNYYNKEKQSL